MKTHTAPVTDSHFDLSHSAFVIRHSSFLIGLLLLAIFFASLPALQAQTVPLFISYQGKVTDSAGVGLGTPTPLNRKVIFRIYSAATGGTLLYTEEQTVTLSGGEFSVLIGQGIVFASEAKPALDTVFTSAGTGRFLEITVDNGDGTINGSDAAITPRQQITSTAYSFRAQSADTVPASAIGTTALASSSVTLAKMASASVNSSTIVDASIATGDLANSAVTLAKVAGNAVDSSKIVDGSIASADIADATIATADIANGAVTAAKLGSDVGLWTVSGADVYRSSGKVGVGTTAPASSLHVRGASGTLLTVSSNVDAVAEQQGIAFAIPATAGTSIPARMTAITRANNANEINFYTNAASGSAATHRMIINENGNVGIGTTNPTDKLQVDGAIKVNSGFDSARIYMDAQFLKINAFGSTANGVVDITTGNGAAGVRLNTGGTSWAAISDRDQKKNFAPVDGDEVLKKLAGMPIRYWNYKWDADDATPHIGPVAQDFMPAFYPGRDDKRISTLEFDGVELAAIQALHRRAEVRAKEVEELRAVVTEQQKRLAELEAKDKARDAKLAAIEAMLSGGKPGALPVSLKKVAAAE